MDVFIIGVIKATIFSALMNSLLKLLEAVENFLSSKSSQTASEKGRLLPAFLFCVLQIRLAADLVSENGNLILDIFDLRAAQDNIPFKAFLHAGSLSDLNPVFQIFHF